MVINKTYRRKTFTVQAIQVSTDNLRGLAEWCGGRIGQEQDFLREPGVKPFVEVVIGVVNGRTKKARAYPGDWITKLHDANNFRVYRNDSFVEAFEEVRSEIEKREAVLELVREEMWPNGSGSKASGLTNKIMNVFA